MKDHELPPSDDQAATAQTVPIADAENNWVEKIAPSFARPYLRLARIDRPIGIWLLLWPCWWSSALAALTFGAPYPDPWHLALFAIGAIVMRSAGCTYNDIVDRKVDLQVERTKGRPIPSGQVTVTQASIFLIALCLIGLLVLVQFNRYTIILGILAVLPTAIYPFMKRLTNWPQAVLGITFNWGALMGWTAMTGSLDWPPVILYLGAVFWTIGYDTIYAHQDKEDDAIIGMKSTALTLGDKTTTYLNVFYAITWVAIFMAGVMSGTYLIFATAMALAAMQLVWQVTTLNVSDPVNCLIRFRSNRLFGLIVFIGLLADGALRALIAGT